MKVIAKWLFLLGFTFFFFVSKQNSSAQIPWHPLQREKDLDMLIREIGKARVVLLGESTHGTHEFYEWRSAITKKLIEEKGFDLIAVEGDWVDSYKVNQFIKGQQQDSSSVIELLKQYDRWPSSLWGNYEMAGLVQWLNGYNQTMISKNKIGFYGLDVYSFWEWTNQDIPVQHTTWQNAIKEIRESFAAYNNDALKYADAVRKTNANHSASTQNLWSLVQKDFEQQPKDEARFVWEQQALLALNGERYFRTMVSDRVQSWNIRENYMAETIKRLLSFYGSHSKAIIWTHNGHAGDAHFSQMDEAGNTSVGEILKKQMGNYRVFSIGFGTNKGSVLAGYYWDAPLIKIEVPAARTGSWENILHELGPDNKIILSRELKNNKAMNQWIAMRSTGAANNTIYGTAIIPKRFDAFVYIDSTSAVRPVKNPP